MTKRCALIKDNVVMNVIAVDADAAKILAADERCSKGDIYDPNTGLFSKPV